ncbi:MAG TPA: hypothetical protein ENJ60_13680 [Aeromonadales bacterium]|nr:hypothetical protein [Aeromonadales bacterium]
MKNIEGQINIDYFPFKKNGEVVTIKSNRPVHLSQLFEGKTIDEVLETIPLIFNVCGIAQSRTSIRAIENIMQKNILSSVDIARDILVLFENAREHLLRVFLDWPGLFDLQTVPAPLPMISQITEKARHHLFKQGKAFSLSSKLNDNLREITELASTLNMCLTNYLFTIPSQQWLEISSLESLVNWFDSTDTIAAKTIQNIFKNEWCSQGYSNTQPLPVLKDNELIQRFTDAPYEKFIAQPDWNNQCFETTALSRQIKQPLIKLLYRYYQNGLITRWIARLVELASIPQQINQLVEKLNTVEYQIPCATDAGIAKVETARGRLIHYVQLDNNLINQYQILAPTEWNFHPEGLLNQSLQNITVNNIENITQVTHLIINSIDPCVGYQLRVH